MILSVPNCGQPLEWDEFLLQNGLIACIIFNAEWLIEVLLDTSAKNVASEHWAPMPC
jgi:hypothetical protein